MAPDRLTSIRSRAIHGSAVASATVLLGAALLAGCGASPDEGNPSQLSLNKAATTSDAQGSQGSQGSQGAQPPPEADSGAPSSEPTSPPTGSPDVAPSTASGPTSASETAGRQPSGDDTTSSPGRCHTSMLDATLRAGHPGAGQRYADLTLVNSSGQTCRVYGFPGLQLVGADGDPLPTDVARTTTREPHAVLLAPGESATATLHWGVVPTGDEPATEPCQPDPERLRVIPPDETDNLGLAWPFGPVCGGGHITVTAFE